MDDLANRVAALERKVFGHTDFDSGLPPATGESAIAAAVARPADGGPVSFPAPRFSEADFLELADKFRQAATLLMIRSDAERGAIDDAVIASFVRYAEMLRQAAATERTR